jgi:hypothetical protein
VPELHEGTKAADPTGMPGLSQGKAAALPAEAGPSGPGMYESAAFVKKKLSPLYRKTKKYLMLLTQRSFLSDSSQMLTSRFVGCMYSPFHGMSLFP